LNIANFLTFSRIFISPVFLVVYLYYEDLGISLHVQPFVLLFILGVLELTDALDGFIARRYNIVTEVGKILDPMADSISRISVFLTFTTGVVQLPIFIVFIFLYRDAFISTLRTLCAMRGITLAARTSGKIKAVIQAFCSFVITAMLVPYSFGWLELEVLQKVSTYCALTAAFYSVVSAMEYFYVYRHDLKDLMRKESS
jgi:CDP-diacylglycerol---glycerol-3-phosphate 3-phosphatidyltransferase